MSNFEIIWNKRKDKWICKEDGNKLLVKKCRKLLCYKMFGIYWV